jgi:hypothetical protein
VLAIAVVRPSLLHPVNRVFFAVSQLIGGVVGQVALALSFFLVLTPMALVARWAGRDVVGRRFRNGAKSYWVRRAAEQSAAVDFRRPY